MTTDLTTLTNLSFGDIAALTGATASSAVILPRLSINREPEDEEGNKLPMGEYCVSQDGTKVYYKTLKFRPFINAYQYNEYDPNERKFVNRSVIIKSFREEPFDEQGGLSCGKVKREEIERLPAQEQVRQRNIKCNRLLYGLVVGEPSSSSDNLDLPVLWKLSGSNFMAPKAALDAITKQKHQYFNHTLELSTKRQKTGSTIYYEAIVTPNLKEVLEFTDEDLEMFKLFQEAIERENNYVISRWKQAKKAAIKDGDKGLLSELDLNDSVEDIA